MDLTRFPVTIEPVSYYARKYEDIVKWIVENIDSKKTTEIDVEIFSRDVFPGIKRLRKHEQQRKYLDLQKWLHQCHTLVHDVNKLKLDPSYKPKHHEIIAKDNFILLAATVLQDIHGDPKGLKEQEMVPLFNILEMYHPKYKNLVERKKIINKVKRSSDAISRKVAAQEFVDLDVIKEEWKSNRSPHVDYGSNPTESFVFAFPQESSFTSGINDSIYQDQQNNSMMAVSEEGTDLDDLTDCETIENCPVLQNENNLSHNSQNLKRKSEQRHSMSKKIRDTEHRHSNREFSICRPASRRTLMPKTKKRMQLYPRMFATSESSSENEVEEEYPQNSRHQIKKRKMDFEITNSEVLSDELDSSVQEVAHVSGNSQPMVWFTKQSPNSTFSNNLGTMFEKQKFGDVVFKFQNDEDIRAYKGILAAQSSVFAAMFEQDENIENSVSKIEIVEFSRPIFQEMLNFIYTDNIPELGDQTKQLLAIAEKYQLKKLKFFCEIELCKTIAVENVLSLLTIADKYSAEQLNKHLMVFIYENLNEVVASKGYEELEKTNIHLMSCIIRYIAARMIQT